MFKYSLRCLWQDGFDFCAKLMSHNGSTQHCAIFILPCHFDHSTLGENVKSISVWDWEVHNLSWDSTNSNYINWLRWSSKMHIVGKLSDWPKLRCCFCRPDMHRIFLISKWLRQTSHCFSLFCLPFGCCSNPYNCWKIDSSLESITCQFWHESSWQN